MSDKRPDERDIDEILASIDEMLSQKQPYTLQDDERKDSVKEGVKASEDTLGLSSSVDLPELSEFDQIDIDEFLSLGMSEEQPKAVSKTEKNIEKEHKAETQADTVHDIDKDAMLNLNQEADEEIDFTLDETDLPNFDDTVSSNQEKSADEQEAQAPEVNDGNDMPLSSEKTQEPADTNTVDDVIHDEVIEDSLAENDFIEDNLDDNSPDETELPHDEHQDDEPVTEDSMPRHRILLTEELLEPSAQEALPLWIEQTSNEAETTEEDNTADKHQANALQASKADEPETDATETETLETEESKAEEEHIKSDTKADHAPQQHVSNADKGNSENTTPVLADDTYIKTNISGNEASDLLRGDAMVFDLDEDIGIDTVYKLETLIAPSEDDLDNHTELVEVMMEEVLQEDNEQPQDLEEQVTAETEKIFLSDDELQDMVQAVSADVAQQINDHLHTWLPGLISIGIKNHMKDLNNKD